MSNIDAVKALITAINFDRFPQIEARHQPDAVFWPFAGPTVLGSVSIQDWYTTFLRDYSDCTYTEEEFIEDGDTVALRATLEAKGFNWRPFTQRVIDLCDMRDGKVASRRLFAMLPDVELDKAATAAMNNATGFRGGTPAETRKIVDGFYTALLGGDAAGAQAFLAEKSALIDSVYGSANGPAAIVEAFASVPRPAFGAPRLGRAVCGPKDAVAELTIDPERPRSADWVRVADGKITVIERYWMLREIGVASESPKRHRRRVIHPM